MANTHSITTWMRLVLSGEIHMDEAPESIQSWARHPIYEGAREIVLMEWVEDRRAELLKVPEKIRCHVAAEVKRLWPMRSALLEEQAAKKLRHR